jgi:hypothetical protein
VGATQTQRVPVSSLMTNTNWSVVPITKKQADAIVLAKHYSHRAPVFWEAFALVEDGEIEGVVVYGQPSPPIQKHSFEGRTFRLYELARLVIQTPKPNAASFLVGRSLKMLSEQPSAVVSYADTEWGHAGIVYQATNWLYTGATKSHDHAYLVEGKRVHPMSLRDQGITNPKQWAKDNNIETAPPMAKHRYFYINAKGKERTNMMSSIRYPVVGAYPKLDKRTYDAGARVTMYVGDVNADGFGGLA